MKKLIVLAALALTLTACGGSEVAETAPQEASQSVEVETSSLAYEDQDDTGDGVLYIVNESGTSEDGNVIKILGDDLSVAQIGLEAEDLDGSTPTVIYVDGKENAIEQLGTGSTAITLEGDALLKGEHTIEAVQKDGETVTFYRIMKYNVE